MSIDNNALLLLVQEQEKDRKDFAASVYVAWHSLMDNERVLLTPYDGNADLASDKIKETIQKNREAYWQEWGSEGRIATLMKKKHEHQRKSLMARYQILDGIRQSQNRQRNKDQDRER